jgi:hypothetical protein
MLLAQPLVPEKERQRVFERIQQAFLVSGSGCRGQIRGKRAFDIP